MNHVTVNLVLLGAQIDVYLLCAVDPAVALALADELLSVFGERTLIVPVVFRRIDYRLSRRC